VNTNVIALLGAGALVVADLHAATIPVRMRQDRTLHVHVYNFANVRRSTLDRGLEEAARILAAAGVQTFWEPGDTDAPEGRTVEIAAGAIAAHRGPDNRGFLVARVVGRVPETLLPGALGFALPSARHGVHVTMFYDRIEGVARTVPLDVAQILGNALAHEIGHVLLSSVQHSRSGIMKAVWSRADYGNIAFRPLKFLPDEVAIVQDAVSRRAALCRSPSPNPLEAANERSNGN
jgi:hypothetical protein